MDNSEGRGRRWPTVRRMGHGDRRRGVSSAAGAVVLLALLVGVGTGGLRPSVLADRLAGIVDEDRVGRVVHAVGNGDVATATDELAALAGSMVTAAGDIAEDVAVAAGDRFEPPAPGSAPLCSLPPLGSVEPIVDLTRHQGWGGHTIDEHVDQTDEQMRARLARHPFRPPAASTFDGLGWATHVVSAAHICVEGAVAAWQAGPAWGRLLRCTLFMGQPVGRRLTRELAEPQVVDEVTVVYQYAEHSAIGYRILTAYPAVGAQDLPCTVTGSPRATTQETN